MIAVIEILFCNQVIFEFSIKSILLKRVNMTSHHILMAKMALPIYSQ